jgi:succinate-acetate transporter protein
MVTKKESNAVNEKTGKTTDPIANAYPVADPAALGLLGLAIAALVLASADLKFDAGLEKSLMIPWVVMFGATAQLIAGGMEFKRQNIFGGTVFSVYSMTMFSIAITLFITNSTMLNQGDITHYAYGLIGILIFSIIATVASLMTNKTLFAILIAVDLAVGLLIPHYLYEFSSVPAGAFLLLTSILSFYGAGAILLNTMAKRTILPLGKPFWKPSP